MPLPAEDKIEILTLLASAEDNGLREKAWQTLRNADKGEMRRVVANPKTAPEVLRFVADNLLPEYGELKDILLWNRSLPADTREILERKPAPKPVAEAAPPVPTLTAAPARLATGPAPESPHSAAPAVNPRTAATQEAAAGSHPDPAAKAAEDQAAVEILAKLAAGAKVEEVTASHPEPPPEATKHDDELTPNDRETLIEKINRMSVVEKIKAALTGNLETRSLLIRDSNKIITRAVLQSPKISDTEAESYAAAKNVSEEVLRLIASNRKFMKTYVVMRALINNPRAPIDVTMPLIGRINDRDLKGLSLNRNVPEVIRSLAIKAIKQKEEALKPKLPGKH